MTLEVNLPPGTRVRAKFRSVWSGWKGKATIIHEGIALRDGRTDWLGTIEACRHEWAVMRDQTPNPEHAEALQAPRLAASGDVQSRSELGLARTDARYGSQVLGLHALSRI